MRFRVRADRRGALVGGQGHADPRRATARWSWPSTCSRTSPSTSASELQQQFLSESTGRCSARRSTPTKTLEQVADAGGPRDRGLVRGRRGVARTARSSGWRWPTPTRSSSARADELQERYPPDPNAAPGCPQVLRSGRVGALSRDSRGDARAGRRGRGAPRAHQARVRAALGDGGADDRARRGDRRDLVRERPVRAALRRGGPAARRGAGAPLRHRGRQLARSTASATTSPARCRAACCRPSCRASPGSRPPRASAPPARATRWAATSTTCSSRAAARLDRGGGRRLRQGTRRRGRDRPRALHAARGRHARAPARAAA